MALSELRRRLKAVDPDLTIIPGGRRRHSTRADRNWEKAAGVICSGCGREAFRSREGLCMSCWDSKHEIEIRDERGILNYFPDTILAQITHKARNADP
ncbi:hypothetical protein LCGC14_2323680 [marine sediment metagenome]|uniref:Uncharacterized protein n=1 Tax=marine sediment metagenome TaxID=412755 RepID=A0A0F9FBT4_9ZZZZ